MSGAARLAARSNATSVLTFAFLALALLALSGCSSFGSARGGPVPYNVEDFAEPDPPSLQALEDDYQIAPLDVVKVTVFQVEDLSGEYEVDLRGNIAMPLVGEVKAVDMTSNQLKDQLTQKLGERYLQNPDVSVGIKASTQHSVTVDGAVRRPGQYQVTGPMTLMQAVAAAQGTEDTANLRRVAIFRQIDGQRMAAAFDLVDIRRGEEADPRVYRGDIIVVDGSGIKALQREILSALPVISFFRPF